MLERSVRRRCPSTSTASTPTSRSPACRRSPRRVPPVRQLLRLKDAYCRRLAAHWRPALNRRQLAGTVLRAAAVRGDALLAAQVLRRRRRRLPVLGRRPRPDSGQGRVLDSVQHLVGRIDVDAAAFYPDYIRSGQRLSGRPLRRMSALTEAMLDSVNYGRSRLARQRNFRFLHAALGSSNRLRIDTTAIDAPMAYPYWTDDPGLRQRLIAHKVYVATYWSEVLRREVASAWRRNSSPASSRCRSTSATAWTTCSSSSRPSIRAGGPPRKRRRRRSARRAAFHRRRAGAFGRRRGGQYGGT